MTERFLGKILCVVLVLALPASMMAADAHAAMMFASGAVALNGMGAPHNSAIFAGDKIQTEKDSAVTLTADGNSVLVSPLSTVVYQGDSIDVDSGSAQIVTKKGMAAHVKAMSVTPASAEGTYRISRESGQVLVAALRGPVRVSDGAMSKTVAEGSMEAFSDPDPQKPGATPTAKLPGAGPLTTKLALLLALGGAAAASVIAIETTGSPSPVSAISPTQ
jgi:hypothetical protein